MHALGIGIEGVSCDARLQFHCPFWSNFSKFLEEKKRKEKKRKIVADIRHDCCTNHGEFIIVAYYWF
jgi:hypothetical protein